MRLLRTALVPAALAFAALTTVAGASPSAIDLYVDIGVGPSLREARPVQNGGTVSVVGLTFWAGPGVELITAQSASAKVRFDLPEGLRWGGRDEPDATEQCTSTPSTAICQSTLLEPITGRTGVGWAWDIVAARAGSYVLRAEIVEASEPDPEPANNTASVTVLVTEQLASPSGPQVPGGVKAGTVKLSPAKPKAGSTVVASVRMTAGGGPVRPTDVTCTASAGTTKVKGVGRAGNGSATCTFKTPKKAKGKALRGTVTFVALGEKHSRRFSARLG